MTMFGEPPLSFQVVGKKAADDLADEACTKNDEGRAADRRET